MVKLVSLSLLSFSSAPLLLFLYLGDGVCFICCSSCWTSCCCSCCEPCCGKIRLRRIGGLLLLRCRLSRLFCLESPPSPSSILLLLLSPWTLSPSFVVLVDWNNAISDHGVFLADKHDFLIFIGYFWPDSNVLLLCFFVYRRKQSFRMGLYITITLFPIK